MTGQCYYCAAGEHHECYGTACTCCGERNAKFNCRVAELVELLRVALAGKRSTAQ
jgi:hypothetical protein